MPKEVKPYKCTTCCRKGFRNPSDLLRHNSKGVKAHPCYYAGCTLSYVQKSGLDDHIRRKHTNEKPRKCPFCPVRFCTSYETNAHMLYEHRELLWHCNVEDCKHGGSRNESEFRKHVNKCHNGANYKKLATRPKLADLDFAAASYGALLTPIASAPTPSRSPSPSTRQSVSNESTPSLWSTPGLTPSSSPSPPPSADAGLRNDELNGSLLMLSILNPAPAPSMPDDLADDFVAKMDWFMTAPEIQLPSEPTHFELHGLETSGLPFPSLIEDPALNGSTSYLSNDFGFQFDTSFPMPVPSW